MKKEDFRSRELPLETIFSNLSFKDRKKNHTHRQSVFHKKIEEKKLSPEFGIISKTRARCLTESTLTKHHAPAERRKLSLNNIPLRREILNSGLQGKKVIGFFDGKRKDVPNNADKKRIIDFNLRPQGDK